MCFIRLATERTFKFTAWQIEMEYFVTLNCSEKVKIKIIKSPEMADF